MEEHKVIESLDRVRVSRLNEGRVSTPAYRIEYKAAGGVHHTPGAWRIDADGKPTPENLAKHIAHLNASFGPGGSNARVGELHGEAGQIVSAKIIRQSDDSVVATWSKTGESKVREAGGPDYIALAGELRDIFDNFQKWREKTKSTAPALFLAGRETYQALSALERTLDREFTKSG